VYVKVMMKSEIHRLQEWLTGMMLVMKVLDRRRCRKLLMSRALNVALCLRNHRKKLRTALMQMSPSLLAVMKHC
jgi:hypothetical protein